ncbi:amidohydrolase family protein [Sphingomonas sp. SUN039]|uniref:amidohydrolase family protein n=1 Tax=Sphingomonas sp. SUN039 TaxID=2937787 RepID=UPI002164CE3F|nr:amidohydrolase [Sphingomonas sp. SUN039]UVO55299.1 amidohydrolase [Sphingomonas sp. SUN039]
MTYAGTRRIIDVDSHLIELENFLLDTASADEKAKIPSMLDQKPVIQKRERLELGREQFLARQGDAALTAEYEAQILDNTKVGWGRLGAFDPVERARAIDLFGYEVQLVLATFTFHQFYHDPDAAVREAGARALNRAMGNFCKDDRRMRAVGYVPLGFGPDKAIEMIEQGLADGCYTFAVDTNEGNDAGRSFTHPDFDPVWAKFVEHRIPVVTHVAINGHYDPVSPSFKNNGRVFHEIGDDAPAGEIGVMTIANSVQLFLGAMIYDGVFERHPALRVISMEHGCLWLPGWLKMIDFTANVFKRLRPFAELPSVTAKRHIKVAPFAGEPVGWVIEQVGPGMLVYASDYPHPEGSGDPIGKFEETMTDCDQATLDAFYFDNMAEVMNLARA